MKNIIISAVLILVSCSAAYADSLETLKQQWQLASSGELTTPQRFTLLQSLSKQSYTLSLQQPDNAELLAWHGIILSSFANIKGGKGGPSLAFQANASINKALKMDPSVLDGAALEKYAIAPLAKNKLETL